MRPARGAMQTSRICFELPRELIAQRPAAERSAARLMVLERRGGVRHTRVANLPALLRPGAVLVLNDTRVLHARLIGRLAGRTASSACPASPASSACPVSSACPASASPVSPASPASPARTGATAAGTGSGREVAFLLLEPLADGSGWRALARGARRLAPATRVLFPEGVAATVEPDGEHEGIVLRCAPALDAAYLERHGTVPLPPYIERAPDPADAERYQTVYAKVPGSAAAPTAGLHFTAELLRRLGARGVTVTRVTLHVGSGTFTPIRTARVEQHTMHRERYVVPAATAAAIEQARRDRRPVVAVGTTVVRTLESAWNGTALRRGAGSTDLFIYPGFPFQVVDQLLTNFHTPRSSLLALVSALAGEERIRRAYAVAIHHRYRFFSYGDAMLIR